MRTVTVSLNDIGKLAEQMSQYYRDMDKKMRTLLERLAQEGIDVAGAAYSLARYDGTNDVSMDGIEWVNDTTLRISASGSAVTFIEFGAGIAHGGGHPWGGKFGFSPGTYGQGKGRQEHWVYVGNPGTNGVELKGKPGRILTEGNPPAMAMYNASKAIHEKVGQIAKEVFAV